MYRSISKLPTPPRANPRAFDFFEKFWSNSPLCCQFRQSNAPPVRASKRVKSPTLQACEANCGNFYKIFSHYEFLVQLVFAPHFKQRHTPYSKMAATQDGLGQVARKRGIEGHGTQEILWGNHREMDRHIVNSGKKAPKQRISLVAYRTLKSQGFSGWWLPSRDLDSPRSKLFFIIAQSASTVSKSARKHIINLKLSLCIVFGEVEYAYCGPSCTAGKSGFCNHIPALMCPLVWLYCLYEQRAKRGEDYVWSRSLGYPPWENVLLLFSTFFQ